MKVWALSLFCVVGALAARSIDKSLRDNNPALEHSEDKNSDTVKQIRPNTLHWINPQQNLNMDIIKTTPLSQLRIYALAVGQGDCTILVCPENKDLFILDMGSRGSSNRNALTPTDVQTILVKYIGTFKTARINIVVSHADEDHYNWFPAVFANRNLLDRIDHFIVGGNLGQYPSKITNLADPTKFNISTINGGNECFENTACTVDKNKYNLKSKSFPQFCNRGKTSSVRFEALVANARTRSNSKNAQSLVLAMEHGIWSIMLPGDFETKEAQDKVINHYKSSTNFDLQVDVYKMAHHGASDKANFENFLEATIPYTAFVSQAAPTTSYHHPRCLAVDRLERKTQGILWDIKYALHYNFTCYDDASRKVIEKPDINFMDIHQTCPGTGPYPCATLKIVSDGTYGHVYYIPYP